MEKNENFSQEFEYKFLLDDISSIQKLDGVKEKSLKQTYLNLNTPETVKSCSKLLGMSEEDYKAFGAKEARVRMIATDGGTTYKLTLKGDGTDSRKEAERDISEVLYYELLRLQKHDANPINKTRYIVEREGIKLEIDEYHDNLNGLLTCEVEQDPKSDQVLSSVEVEAIIKSTLGGNPKNVTEDKKFKNAALAEMENAEVIDLIDDVSKSYKNKIERVIE